MDTIEIRNVTVSDHEITCDIISSGDICQAFREPVQQFFYRSNISLEGTPKSIAVLPVIGTLLPMAWLFDVKLSVEECDEDFVNSVESIKQGYMNMYPDISFKGEFSVGKVCRNSCPDHAGAVALFSGGLDSHDTAIRHAEEKPALLILRGADISIWPKDDAGWEEIVSQVDRFAEAIGSDRVSVTTNFRRIENYRFLNDFTASKAGGDGTYWYCFQHGLALLTHAAPVVWQKKLKTVYIASSYTESEDGNVTCASDPSLDNNVHFCGAGAVHDGYQYSRIDKLRHAADWIHENHTDLYLRVCLGKVEEENNKNGRNCCHCEKCYRTILGLYVIGEDPKNYGFDVESLSAFSAELHERSYAMVKHFRTRYLPIIRLLQETYTRDEAPEELKWLYDFKIDEDSDYFKWVDSYLAVLFERIVTAKTERRAALRKADRLKKKNQELKEEIRKLKAGKKDSGASGIKGVLKNLFK